MTQFFSRLSYSFGNEDFRTEQKALKINKNDKVLTITASGDRPLHLLLDECQEIISVDANPIQNHLLNLKKAAMQVLDYDHYISFLGAVQGNHRKETLNKVLPYMEESSQRYWVQKKAAIEKGIIYQGFVEKKLKTIVSPVFKLFRGKKIDKLFSFTDLEEQQKFVVQDWDKLYWRKTFHLALNSVFSRLLLAKVIDDPGLYDHLDGEKSLGTYFYKKMHNSLMKNLAQESILFSLLLRGKVEKPAFPPYLTESGTKSIKMNVDKIKTVNGNVITYLESMPNESFDCFSLSDVASYLSYPDFMKLLKEIKRVAKPGARYSIRQFLTSHQMPELYRQNYVRDFDLEKDLENLDRCFVYKYMVGTIYK